jgi:hypothetical protein
MMEATRSAYGQPMAFDPSRAPARPHVLWVPVRVLPSRIRGDAAGTIAAIDRNQAKEAGRRSVKGMACGSLVIFGDIGSLSGNRKRCNDFIDGHDVAKLLNDRF